MGFDLRLLKQARSAKLALGAAVLLGLAAAVTIIFQARQISRVVAQVFLEGHTLQQVMPLLWGLIAIFVARAVLVFLSEGAAGEIAICVKQNLRELLLQKIMRLGPAYAQAQTGGAGELTAAAVQGIEALDGYFSQFLPQLFWSALIPCGILVAVFPLDWLSGIVLLFTAPLIPLFMVLIGSASQAVTRKQWSALSRMSAFFLDTLQGLVTLKLLGQSKNQAHRISEISEKYRAATMSVLRVTFLSALVLELVATISTAVVAVEIGLRLLHYQLQFEQAFFILMLAPEFYMPLRQLGLRFHAGMSGVAAAQKLFAILDEPEPPTYGSISSGNGETPVPDLRALKDFTLTFDHVSFTYPERNDKAVKEIHFAMHAGEKVAVVGASGAGKSTLAQMLLKFIEPQVGRILVNQQPLFEVNPEAWRRNIAWVAQMPTLFQGSIAENICLGMPGADFSAIRTAASKAGLDDWIMTLPAGYQTLVGERGARLSGGQAQRLAVARAFLRDAPLLVLDEPTAHLDPQQELLLDESLQALSSGRTLFVVAHRLQTVVRADKILVMDGGRIVETGNHAGLMALDGVYARMIRAYGGEK